MTYQGVPNKKRRVVVDQNGHIIPVDRRSGASHYFMVAASGTITSAGHLTITGTEFRYDSIVTATYRHTSAGTAPIAVAVDDGTCTFKGDTSAAFYYTVINQTF